MPPAPAQVFLLSARQRPPPGAFGEPDDVLHMGGFGGDHFLLKFVGAIEDRLAQRSECLDQIGTILRCEFRDLLEGNHQSQRLLADESQFLP